LFVLRTSHRITGVSASISRIPFINLELGEKTKEYLIRFHHRLPNDPADYGVYRQELTSLRYAWFEVHRRVKPVSDADTLHLPSALIQVLVRRLQTLPDFAKADFAVFHTERLNFLQVVATGIRDTISSIASITEQHHYAMNWD